MSEHPHAQLQQRTYHTSDETRGCSQLLSGPVRLPRCGRGAVSGDFRGLEAMKTRLAHYQQLSAGTVKQTPLALYADDTWALVPQVMTASRRGRALEMEGPAIGGSAGQAGWLSTGRSSRIPRQGTSFGVREQNMYSERGER